MNKILISYNARILILFLGITLLLQGGACAGKPARDILNYKITPVQMPDRIVLKINLHYKTNTDSSFLIGLPQDNYGTPEIYKYVTTISGENGCRVEQTEKLNQRKVYPTKKKEVWLYYEISYDPITMQQFAFGPSVSKEHFHVAGCQWLLRIGDLSEKNHYQIAIVKPSSRWNFYSSLSAIPEKMDFVESFENLLSFAIGGGTQFHAGFKIKNKPVQVFVQGLPDSTNSKIAIAAEKIVSFQRKWFDDYEADFFNITILQRPGVIAGTCVPNFFVCFVKEDINTAEINKILAHEMFHTWLPNKFKIDAVNDDEEIKFEWLYEGISDYLSRKILLEAGLMSIGEFAESINRDIIDIADNPSKASTLSELESLSKLGKYSTVQKKLSYYRGSLIALLWEQQIKNKNPETSLQSFIIDLYQLSKKTNGKLSELDLFGIGSGYGIDILSDLNKFIVSGKPIKILPDALGKSFELKKTEFFSFNLGFELTATFQSQKISGVIDGGAAYKAGLRNDQDFISIKNSNRFSNNWSPGLPIEVTIKLNNAEKVISYFPWGNIIELMLYQPIK